MSEAGEEQPLSRRERRLRNIAETGAVPTVSEGDSGVAEPAEALDFEPVISTVNPDGSVRSRREIRALREQAIADHLEQQLEATQAFSREDLKEARASAENEAVAVDDAAVEEIATEETVVEEITVEETVIEETAADLAAVEETAAEEAAELEAVAIENIDAEAEDADESDVVEADVDEAHAEATELEEVDTDDVDLDDVDDAEDLDASDAEGDDTDESDLEAVDVTNVSVSLDSEPDDAEDEPEIAGAEAFEAKSAARDSYSFPDIAPLDDSVSVFDTPDSPTALRAADSGDQSDFDDLITSAVAQEGSGSTTGNSALILPNLGHTGGLSGPLGDTGELFVTGSFELPKSLGETGGHARLLDSGSEDADELPAAAYGSTGDDGGMAPVSAARAVSARTTGALVSTPTTEKSRLPAVLIATGGGLIVIIAGLAVWAASTGFFA